MAGIRIIERDGKAITHPTIWVDPEEVPTLFLVVKDGATALAHPDYIGETLHSVNQGDLDLRDAWDHLLVKTKDMEYPRLCEVRVRAIGAAFVVNGQTVHVITF
ncbi:hypothetical protein ACFW2V_13650 [Streptomyces sp. NPDC058947]|uniref:hypothetical protein n=1 Tax=Streptomyces sp. NPDC058947 TaxID=3346675 RepID=UPI0036BF33E9